MTSIQLNPYLLSHPEYPLAKVLKQYDALIASGKSVVNLCVGDPKLETFPGARQAITTFIEQSPISQYPKTAGCPELRQAIANWVQRNHGLTLNPETQVLSSNGSKEAIFSFPLLFNWAPDELILFGDLSYPVYASSAGMFGINTHVVPLCDQSFLPDLTQVSTEILDRCKLFWINSPHNPTTAVASHEYLKSLLDLAETHDFLICSDECYNSYYDTEAPASMLDFHDSDRWVVFRSLSKRSCMTGYRSGAILSLHTELMKAVQKGRIPMGVAAPPVIQAASKAAWNDDAHAEENRLSNIRRRDRWKAFFEDLGCDVVGYKAGFFLWMCHPAFKTSEALCAYLLEKGVFVTPGTVFGAAGEGYVRAAFCVPDEVLDDIIAA